MTDTIMQRRRRVTAADVARAAGVSRSAVSRAFTEGAYLDAEKRRVILAAAAELGYRPNALAAGLQGAQSNLVAIFVGEMLNDYDKEVAAALIAGLNAAGKWPIVIGGSGDVAREAVLNVLRYPVEAMILRSGSLGADIVEACGKLSIPVISSGRTLDAPLVDNVCCRNAEGMMLGTRLLLDRGRRRFAFIGGPERFWSSPQRRDGVLRALAGQGLSPVGEAVGNYTVQGGHDAAVRLLDGAAFDALVCANDAMAVGALGALREAGADVPAEVSVLGFDDIGMAGWPGLNLTTLRNPIDGLVATVIDLLTSRAAKPDRPDETRWLDAELVLRGTH
ncbi:LacI family DNA-binding transcriptional regulator [Pseudooceanicola sp. LIPI14-2-Ac024]|uniref:LacI family DNA-binding transcriptional regulator n=1 Tax=Pseudooceanicola sp. LIPI14-2-Ac024 TaxID=3344875 RepID=UPI0035CFD99B